MLNEEPGICPAPGQAQVPDVIPPPRPPPPPKPPVEEPERDEPNEPDYKPRPVPPPPVLNHRLSVDRAGKPRRPHGMLSAGRLT